MYVGMCFSLTSVICNFFIILDTTVITPQENIYLMNCIQVTMKEDMDLFCIFLFGR